MIHNIQKEPKYVKVNGVKVIVNWDSKTKKIIVPFVVKPTKETEIKVKLNR